MKLHFFLTLWKKSCSRVYIFRRHLKKGKGLEKWHLSTKAPKQSLILFNSSSSIFFCWIIASYWMPKINPQRVFWVQLLRLKKPDLLKIFELFFCTLWRAYLNIYFYALAVQTSADQAGPKFKIDSLDLIYLDYIHLDFICTNVGGYKI